MFGVWFLRCVHDLELYMTSKLDSLCNIAVLAGVLLKTLGVLIFSRFFLNKHVRNETIVSADSTICGLHCLWSC